MFYTEDSVVVKGGILVWDGMNAPEIIQHGERAGQPKFSLRAVFPPTCPDLADLDQLANKALHESKWRGTLPPGGSMPIKQVGPQELNGMFPGWFSVSFSTQFLPEVFDTAVNPVDRMAWNQIIYTGQKVDVLCSCYDYEVSGNKGITCGLSAVMVHTAEPGQRITFGADRSSAFGGGGQAPQGQAPGGYSPPQGQAPGGYSPPQGQAPGGYSPPQGQAPQGQAPGGYSPPQGQAPQQQPPQGQAPAQGAPNYNYLGQ